MKRDDMIEKMIELTNYHDDGYLEPYVADKLLTMLEEEGMLPPQIVNPMIYGGYSSYIHFIDCNLHHNCIDYGKEYYLNEWEE